MQTRGTEPNTAGTRGGLFTYTKNGGGTFSRYPSARHHLQQAPSHSCTSSKSGKVKVPFATKLGVGAIAGILGTCCVFPLDVVKTRLQNQVL